MAEETEPVGRKAFKQQAERLREEIVKLRRKVEKATGQSGVKRPEGTPAMPDEGTAARAGFEREMNLVKQDLADLALAINRLSRGESVPDPKTCHRQQVTKSGERYRVSLKGEVRNRTITIQNQGRNLVVNPRVTVNGRRDWSSTASILQEVCPAPQGELASFCSSVSKGGAGGMAFGPALASAFAAMPRSCSSVTLRSVGSGLPSRR